MPRVRHQGSAEKADVATKSITASHQRRVVHIADKPGFRIILQSEALNTSGALQTILSLQSLMGRVVRQPSTLYPVAYSP